MHDHGHKGSPFMHKIYILYACMYILMGVADTHEYKIASTSMHSKDINEDNAIYMIISLSPDALPVMHKPPFFYPCSASLSPCIHPHPHGHFFIHSQLMHPPLLHFVNVIMILSLYLCSLCPCHHTVSSLLVLLLSMSPSMIIISWCQCPCHHNILLYFSPLCLCLNACMASALFVFPLSMSPIMHDPI